MAYTLEQLRGLVAVAEELHFGRAAARLRMTQPPLSRQIQKLEAAVGAQLLDRDNRRVALTAGRRGVPRARRGGMLALAEAAPDLARRVSSGSRGLVRIGFTAASTFGILGRLLNELERELPEVRIDLSEMVTREQVAALASEELDLGLARPPFDADLFDSRLLHREALLVAVPAGHRLTGLGPARRRRPISPREPLIFHSPAAGAVLLRPGGQHGAAGAGAGGAQRQPDPHDALAGLRRPRRRVRARLGHAAGHPGRRLRAAAPRRCRSRSSCTCSGRGSRTTRRWPGRCAVLERTRDPDCDARAGITRCGNTLGQASSVDVSYRATRVDADMPPADTRRPPRAPGLLSFPVTHFDDRPRLRRAALPRAPRLAGRASASPACSPPAAPARASRSPRPRSTRWSGPRSTRSATSCPWSPRPPAAPPRRSPRPAPPRQAGAAGLLLFPPYLTEASQAGLVAHVSAVCRATDLGVIVYSRANAVLDDITVAELADRNPNLIGLKDGVGDIERMTRTYAKVGDRLIYIGGLPTAETFALPLLQLGVSTYSSALYNFLPEFALRFFAAVRAQDRAAVYGMLNDFVIPYLDIRDRARGLRGLHHQGRPDRGRPRRRPGPPPADRPDPDRPAPTWPRSSTRSDSTA